MDEYLNDFKGHHICIRKISPHCGCWRCSSEKKEKAKDSGMSRFGKILSRLIKWIDGTA